MADVVEIAKTNEDNMQTLMARFDKLEERMQVQPATTAKDFKKLARGNPNFLEKAVYYVEDASRGYLPAIGKVAGYGFLGYKVGELGYKGFRRVMDYLKP